MDELTEGILFRLKVMEGEVDRLNRAVRRLEALAPPECPTCRWNFVVKEELANHLAAGGGACPGRPTFGSR